MFPSFLEVMGPHILGVENLHFSMGFWGPRVRRKIAPSHDFQKKEWNRPTNRRIHPSIEKMIILHWQFNLVKFDFPVNLVKCVFPVNLVKVVFPVNLVKFDFPVNLVKCDFPWPSKKKHSRIPTAGTQEWKFGRWVSFSKGWFSGSILVFGGARVMDNSCRRIWSIKQYPGYQHNISIRLWRNINQTGKKGQLSNYLRSHHLGHKKKQKVQDPSVRNQACWRLTNFPNNHHQPVCVSRLTADSPGDPFGWSIASAAVGFDKFI